MKKLSCIFLGVICLMIGATFLLFGIGENSIFVIVLYGCVPILLSVFFFYKASKTVSNSKNKNNKTVTNSKNENNKNNKTITNGKNEAYDKLMISLERNELEDFLIGKGHYRVYSPEEKFFNIMNNYQAIIFSLNEYGKSDNDFAKKLNESMINILERKKPGSTYSMCQLIRLQLILEKREKNSIEFIDDNLLLKLKESILENEEYFKNFKHYEGEGKENGMMDAINNWNKDLCLSIGKGFL